MSSNHEFSPNMDLWVQAASETQPAAICHKEISGRGTEQNT